LRTALRHWKEQQLLLHEQHGTRPLVNVSINGKDFSRVQA
jgi:hypothetical protein